MFGPLIVSTLKHARNTTSQQFSFPILGWPYEHNGNGLVRRSSSICILGMYYYNVMYWIFFFTKWLGKLLQMQGNSHENRTQINPVELIFLGLCSLPIHMYRSVGAKEKISMKSEKMCYFCPFTFWIGIRVVWISLWTANRRKSNFNCSNTISAHKKRITNAWIVKKGYATNDIGAVFSQ